MATKKKSRFERWAERLSEWAGSASTFKIAVLGLVIWAATGPLFHFNDTWQLIVNTSTTIITFLMVFLIQNTQNRDNDALHIKLDELLRVSKDAQTALLDLDERDAKQLKKMRKRYVELGREAECDDNEVKNIIDGVEEPESPEK